MFPLYDERKLPGSKPFVTLFLIGVNVIVFLVFSSSLKEAVFNFGVIPEKILEGEKLFTLFSSMFFHVGISHLLGNMWFLWVFGRNLEKKLGKVKFLIFYLLVGVGASLVYLLFSPQAQTPAVGASGAISGVLGAYLVSFPKSKIVSLVLIFFFLRIVALPIFIFVGIWFLYQLLYIGTATSVAYWAHIGGFVFGVLAAKYLFNKNNSYWVK